MKWRYGEDMCSFFRWGSSNSERQLSQLGTAAAGWIKPPTPCWRVNYHVVVPTPSAVYFIFVYPRIILGHCASLPLSLDPRVRNHTK